MKDGAVVPQVVSRSSEFSLCDIVHDPTDSFRKISTPLFVSVDCGLGNVRNCYVLIPTCQQIIHQRGFTSTYVNDDRIFGRDFLDQRERCFEVRAIPADRVGFFLCIDFVPMRLSVHNGSPQA